MNTSGKQLYTMTINKYPPKWVEKADHNNFREKIGLDTYMDLLTKFLQHCDGEFLKNSQDKSIVVKSFSDKNSSYNKSSSSIVLS